MTEVPYSEEGFTFENRDNDIVYPEKVISFFKRRGISEGTMRENWITHGMYYLEQHKKEVDTLQFPYIKDYKLSSMKYRGPKINKKNTYFTLPGDDRIPYGYDNLKFLRILAEDQHGKAVSAEHFVITSDEIDLLSLWECNEKMVISMPDGNLEYDPKEINSRLDWLGEISEQISKVKIIVLAINDNPMGKLIIEEIARRIGKEKCYTVRYPDECTSVNDVFIYHKEKGIIDLISNARPYPVAGIINIKDREEELDDIFERGIIPGMDVKWNNISDIYKVALGEYTTVTGFQGQGKSELVEDMAVDLCVRKKLPLGIFSAEHATLIHMTRIAEKYIGKPFKIRDGKVYDEKGFMTRDEWEAAKRFMKDNVYWIEKQKGVPMHPEELLEKKRILVLNYGCQLFIDDPYNRMDHQRNKDWTIEEYVSWFLEIYQEFHEKYNAHGWIVAHPKSIDPKRYSKKEAPIALLKDISGGAMWSNKSLNAFTVARQGVEGGTDASENKPTIFMTQKIKFKWNGKLSRTELHFNKINGRYTEEKYEHTPPF